LWKTAGVNAKWIGEKSPEENLWTCVRLADIGETGMMMKFVNYTRKWNLPGISDGEDCSGWVM
jgi:hypothetical protein